jgi:glutamate-1-semialdehyde 2,1-aminomutase
MMPTEDAQWVGTELARRFGLPYWGFTTSATDANRAAIRIARMITNRDLVLVFAHGSRLGDRKRYAKVTPKLGLRSVYRVRH